MFAAWKKLLPVGAAIVLVLSLALPAQAAKVIKAGAGTSCTSYSPTSVSIAKGTKVVYRLNVELGVLLPGFVRTQGAKRVIENALEGLKRRVELG